MDTQPTGAQVERELRTARKRIDGLVGTRQLSEDGLGWLVTTLDPFHDTEIRLEGYPDQISARSVCQCFQRKFTVVAPAAAGAGNWDAHFFYAPYSVAQSNAFTGHGIGTGGKQLASPGGYAFTNTAIPGGVAVTTGAAGAPTWTMTGEVTQQYPLTANTFACPVLQEGHRLIAVAYEVTNTTAELYKQGDVTVYKQPTMPADGVVYSVQGSAPFPVNQAALMKFISAPPRNIADAALYPNAKVWSAKDGVYAVLPMNNIEQAPSRLRPSGFQYVFAQDGSTGDITFAVGSDMSVAANVSNGCNVNHYPFDNVGSYFTGLSNQTTLVVTVRYIFERFPSLTSDAEDSNFLTLATPSPSWDPVALELYGRVLSQMPPAVPVAENGLGEWFGKVVSWIGEAAPVVGKIVGNFVPGADAVGRMVGNIASGASSSMAASPTTKSKDYPKGTGDKAKKKPKKKK